MLLISFLIVISSQTVAQDIYKLETSYEKKRKEIAVDAVHAIINNDIQMAFGVAAGLASLKESEDYSEWKELEFYEKILAVSWGVINWLEPETYSDFRMFQRMGPVCEEYARKRTTLEKKKTLLDIEREQKRNYVPPIGALSTIMMKTGSDFSKQMKKGEYEKQVQFRKRIAETGPHIFDSIAQSYCINQALYGTSKNERIDWDNMITVYSFSIDQALDGTRIGYDVESETDTIYMWHQSENKVLATCHISPETKQKIANLDRTIQIDSLELCIVNGDVLPYKMALATNKKEQWLYSFHPLAKNATIDTNVVFPVYKTGITDTNILQVMGNHVFDYNKIMYQRKLELKKEQERIAAQKAEIAAQEAREKLEEELTNKLNSIRYKYKVNNRGAMADYNYNYYSSLSSSFVKDAFSAVYYAFEATLDSNIIKISQLSYSGVKEYIKENHLTEDDIERIESHFLTFVSQEESYRNDLKRLTQVMKILDGLMVDATYNSGSPSPIGIGLIDVLISATSYAQSTAPASSELSKLQLKKGRKSSMINNNNDTRSLLEELLTGMDDLKNGKYTAKAYFLLSEFIVNENKGAAKEWEKRKDKYRDIVEFYEHFISEDYKPRK